MQAAVCVLCNRREDATEFPYGPERPCQSCQYTHITCVICSKKEIAPSSTYRTSWHGKRTKTSPERFAAGYVLKSTGAPERIIDIDGNKKSMCARLLKSTKPAAVRSPILAETRRKPQSVLGQVRQLYNTQRGAAFGFIRRTETCICKRYGAKRATLGLQP